MTDSPTEHLVITRARHVGADFSGVDASFSAQESSFTACSFDGAILRSAVFGAGRGTTVYTSCSFDGARIEGAAVGIARFENCSFRHVDIRHFFCHAAEFVDCEFSGKIMKAVFDARVGEMYRAGTGRSRNRYERNDFSTTDLVDVTFRGGVDLRDQRLPTGHPFYFVEDVEEFLHRARLALGDPRFDRYGSDIGGLLSALDEERAGGQTQFLLRVDDFGRRLRSDLTELVRAIVGSSSVRRPGPDHESDR